MFDLKDLAKNMEETTRVKERLYQGYANLLPNGGNPPFFCTKILTPRGFLEVFAFFGGGNRVHLGGALC